MRKESDEMAMHPDVMEEILRQRAADAERRAVERRERILSEACASVKANDRDPERYITAARACKQLRRLRETLGILEQGIRRCPPSAPFV